MAIAGKVPSSRALLSLFARSLSGIEYFARELFADDLGTGGTLWQSMLKLRTLPLSLS